MPSRAREKQLAKQHARRQAERRAADRRRKVVAGAVGAVFGIIAIAIGAWILFGGDDPADPAAAPTSSASAPGSAQVTPVVEPPSTVACGGEVPAAAGEPKDQYPSASGTRTVDTKGTYTATVETSCGTIVVDLYADVAPQTVASFAFLADEGFFDGLTFHRIVPGFVIQGGDPLGDGTGGPGYAFADEIDPEVTFDRPGLLAMANSGPGTNGSQFFVTLGGDEATGHLNGLHTIFGEVTEGMDVVEAIAAVPGDPQTGAPSEAVYIDSVTIEEAR
jgi:peptidyl-prolyl cis-trans isomerase A (cyclophilin A)